MYHVLRLHASMVLQEPNVCALFTKRSSYSPDCRLVEKTYTKPHLTGVEVLKLAQCNNHLCR